MGPKRLNGVSGAGRLEPAGAAQEWGQNELVDPDSRDQELRCHGFDSPILFNVDSKSLATSFAGTFAAPDLAITTRSIGTSVRFERRKASRINRLALFLTTAP